MAPDTTAYLVQGCSHHILGFVDICPAIPRRTAAVPGDDSVDHCGPLMLCGCSFPGRAQRQQLKRAFSLVWSVWPLRMSGTRCRSTFFVDFSQQTQCTLFHSSVHIIMTRHVYMTHHSASVSSLDRLHGALYGFYSASA